MKAHVRIDHAALSRVVRSLKKAAPKGIRAEAVVGYDVGIAPYAVYVHENLSPKVWTKAGTGPKFLEEPSRLYRSDIVAAFFSTFKSTRSIVRGVYSAARLLLEKSLRVVPVDTGRLRSSAFAAVIREEN